jgi:hypothetical protein
MSALAGLRTAEPDGWHRAALAWTALAEELDRTCAALAGAGPDLSAAWSGGRGAVPARVRLRGLAVATVDAGGPARRIALALLEHAYELAALRRLAHQDLSMLEQAAVLARLCDLDARTSATLLGNPPPGTPPAGTSPPGMSTGGTVAAGPGGRASVEAERVRSPAQVRAWWGSLAPEQRERLLREYPDAVGWLDGVPAADRDRANRAVLAQRIDELAARRADLSHRLDRLRFGPLPGLPDPIVQLLFTPPVLLPWVVPMEIELAQVRERLAGLEAVRSSLAPYGEQALLLGVDGGTGSGADGRVVVALGDPDHARHTAVFVPGASTDPRDTPGAVNRMARVWRESDAMTSRLGDVSVVFWLGYDAPDLFGSPADTSARAGGEQLRPFLSGLAATHDGAPAHVTLIGHSYGTTVVAEAALSSAPGLDHLAGDVVVVGSPGMHADHATDLRLDPRHVWGGLAAGDPIGGRLGELPFVHGQEPTDPALGANRFVVDTSGHDGYWDPDSVSLRNQAAIVAGRYDLVSLVHGSLPPGTRGPFPP